MATPAELTLLPPGTRAVCHVHLSRDPSGLWWVAVQPDGEPGHVEVKACGPFANRQSALLWVDAQMGGEQTFFPLCPYHAPLLPTMLPRPA